MKPVSAAAVASEPRTFATTRWSLIVSATSANSDEQAAHAALTELCRSYWRPVFLFVSRQGYYPEEAQDLTQDFFVMILQSHWLEQADRHRGRFRSFLLKSLQNFLSHAREREQAIKRGGKVDFVSWDEWLAEAPSELSISNQMIGSLPPENLFDLQWAATVVDHALQRLREECERKGRLRLFENLRGYLTCERGDVSYSALGAALGIAETMVKTQLHNLRQRYRWLLRDEVAQTVANPSDLEEEIRHLCLALASISG